MLLRKFCTAVSGFAALVVCFGSVGAGAAYAGSVESAARVSDAKLAVTHAIASGSLALHGDVGALDLREMNVASESGFHLVTIPSSGAGQSRSVVKVAVGDDAAILGYSEKRVSPIGDSSALLVSTWKNGSPVAVFEAATDDYFVACLEKQGVDGKIAKKVLQKCFNGTLMPTGTAVGCALGFGISRDAVKKCEPLLAA
ncbi:hypothetical protein ACWEKR_01360 [Nocardia sp. NPDC004573]